MSRRQIDPSPPKKMTQPATEGCQPVIAWCCLSPQVEQFGTNPWRLGARRSSTPFEATLNHHWLGCPNMLLKFSQILRDTPNCLTLDENCGRKRNGSDSVWVVRLFQTFCEYSKVDSNFQASSLCSWGYPRVNQPTRRLDSLASQ